MKILHLILFLLTLIALCSASILAQSRSPKVLKFVAPKYSPSARATGTAGKVEVSVSIDKDGKVISTTVISGHQLLTATSEIAAKEWTFTANKQDKTDVTITFIYTFQVKKAAKNKYKETTYKTKFKKPYSLEIIATEYSRDNF